MGFPEQKTAVSKDASIQSTSLFQDHQTRVPIRVASQGKNLTNVPLGAKRVQNGNLRIKNLTPQPLGGASNPAGQRLFGGAAKSSAELLDKRIKQQQ